MIFGLKEAGALERVVYYAQALSFQAKNGNSIQLKETKKELDRAYEAAFGRSNHRASAR